MQMTRNLQMGAGVKESMIPFSDSVPAVENDMGSGKVVKAMPEPSRVQPHDVVQRLRDALKELDCGECNIQDISEKIRSILKDQHSELPEPGVTGDLLSSMSEAESVLEAGGQIVKSRRIAKMRGLLNALPAAKPKKQEKILREILYLTGKNVGVSIGKRSFCGRKLLCNPVCIAGTAVIVAGAATMVAIASAGLLDEIPEMVGQEDHSGQGGNDNTPLDVEDNTDNVRDDGVERSHSVSGVDPDSVVAAPSEDNTISYYDQFRSNENVWHSLQDDMVQDELEDMKKTFYEDLSEDMRETSFDELRADHEDKMFKLRNTLRDMGVLDDTKLQNEVGEAVHIKSDIQNEIDEWDINVNQMDWTEAGMLRKIFTDEGFDENYILPSAPALIEENDTSFKEAMTKFITTFKKSATFDCVYTHWTADFLNSKMDYNMLGLVEMMKDDHSDMFDTLVDGVYEEVKQIRNGFMNNGELVTGKINIERLKDIVLEQFYMIAKDTFEETQEWETLVEELELEDAEATLPNAIHDEKIEYGSLKTIYGYDTYKHAIQKMKVLGSGNVFGLEDLGFNNNTRPRTFALFLHLKRQLENGSFSDIESQKLFDIIDKVVKDGEADDYPELLAEIEAKIMKTQGGSYKESLYWLRMELLQKKIGDIGGWARYKNDDKFGDVGQVLTFINESEEKLSAKKITEITKTYLKAKEYIMYSSLLSDENSLYDEIRDQMYGFTLDWNSDTSLVDFLNTFGEESENYWDYGVRMEEMEGPFNVSINLNPKGHELKQTIRFGDKLRGIITRDADGHKVVNENYKTNEVTEAEAPYIGYTIGKLNKYDEAEVTGNLHKALQKLGEMRDLDNTEDANGNALKYTYQLTFENIEKTYLSDSGWESNTDLTRKEIDKFTVFKKVDEPHQNYHSAQEMVKIQYLDVLSKLGKIHSWQETGQLELFENVLDGDGTMTFTVDTLEEAKEIHQKLKDLTETENRVERFIGDPTWTITTKSQKVKVHSVLENAEEALKAELTCDVNKIGSVNVDKALFNLVVDNLENGETEESIVNQLAEHISYDNDTGLSDEQLKHPNFMKLTKELFSLEANGNWNLKDLRVLYRYCRDADFDMEVDEVMKEIQADERLSDNARAQIIWRLITMQTDASDPIQGWFPGFDPIATLENEILTSRYYSRQETLNLEGITGKLNREIDAGLKEINEDRVYYRDNEEMRKGRNLLNPKWW